VTHHPLEARTAIVTGASSGIGRAIAERLGGAGAAVHLVGRTMEPMEHSVTTIVQAGGSATATLLDVRDSEALEGFVAKTAADAGRLDVMVNSAGVARADAILTGTTSQWQELFDVNVIALLVGSRAAVTAMRATGSGGHIINISSIVSQRSNAGVYGATKAAVNYVTEGLRQELEGDNIRITSLLPGVIATNAVRNFPPEVVNLVGNLAGIQVDARPGERLPDDVLAAAQAALDSHIARPEDIAEMVVHIVGLPLRLNIAEVVVRPAQTLSF
jgi:NADP-dependent 3-hydroxy acid dehydrogenase YdfG